MEKAPALDTMPLYEFCMVAFYRGAPAPGAPVVPTPLVQGERLGRYRYSLHY